MKTIEDLNLYTYFGNRELPFTPGHFVVASTPFTPESKNWVIESLTGRFSIVLGPDPAFEDFITYERDYPAFEDSKEAVFYELTWS